MDSVGTETEHSSEAASTATRDAPAAAERENRRDGASGPTSAAGGAMTPILATRMRAFRNARYHEDREGFFNALNRWTNFLGIILGSGAFAGGATAWPALAMTGGALAAIVSASRLVFDFSGKARIHGDLRASFLQVLSDAQHEEANAGELESRMINLYKREPEIFNAVNVMAYNSAQVAFGRPTSTLVIVDGWKKGLRHVLRFEPSDFPDAVPS